MISHNPGEWPENITNKIREILNQRGPEQISNIQFPLNKYGRRFSVQNFHRRMCNGEDVLRSWLIYSVSKNKIFSFAVVFLV